MKLKLNWEPLDLRRKVGRLTNFHAAIAGRLAIPVRSALRPAGRNLRHTSTTNSYIPIPANKNCYKFSFIPRTIPEWNALPNSVTSIQEKTIFKTAAHNHLIEQSNQNEFFLSLRQHLRTTNLPGWFLAERWAVYPKKKKTGMLPPSRILHYCLSLWYNNLCLCILVKFIIGYVPNLGINWKLSKPILNPICLYLIDLSLSYMFVC